MGLAIMVSYMQDPIQQGETMLSERKRKVKRSIVNRVHGFHWLSPARKGVFPLPLLCSIIISRCESSPIWSLNPKFQLINWLEACRITYGTKRWKNMNVESTSRLLMRHPRALLTMIPYSQNTLDPGKGEAFELQWDLSLFK